MSLSEISSEYGIARSTINGWIKDVKEIKISEDNEYDKEVISTEEKRINYVTNLIRLLKENK